MDECYDMLVEKIDEYYEELKLEEEKNEDNTIEGS